MANTKAAGRTGKKNLPRQSLPLNEAIQQAKSRALHTAKQTAAILGTTKQSVYHAVKSEKLPAVQWGKRVFIRGNTILHLLEPTA